MEHQAKYDIELTKVFEMCIKSEVNHDDTDTTF